MSLKKNKSTIEKREFWESVEARAKLVESWPAWKHGETSDSNTSANNNKTCEGRKERAK